MTEERAVAILMRNLKKGKTKPSNWIDISLASNFLIHHEKWGIKKMSDFFEVSEYQLRQIDKINELNSDVKELVRENKFGVEECYQLWRLGKRRQSEAAKAMIESEMKSHEVRQFVHLLIKNKKMSIQEAKKLTEATRMEKIKILMLPLASETYYELGALTEKSGVKNVHDLILKIVEDYIEKN